MLSLDSFLSAASKSTLATFRTHWKLAPGSVVSSKVVEEAVRSRAFDAGRLRPLFERLTPAQRDVLCAIYGADDRGVGEEELREAFSSAERPLLDETVEEFRREMVVARTADGRLMGFAELWPDLSDLFRTHDQMPDQHALCRFVRYQAEIGKIIFPLLAEVMQEGPRKEQASVDNGRIALRCKKVGNAEHR